MQHRCQNRKRLGNPENQPFTFVSFLFHDIHIAAINLAAIQHDHHSPDIAVFKMLYFPVGRQKFVRDVLHAMPLAQEQMEEKDKRDRLQFCKPRETHPVTEIKLSGTTKCYKQHARQGVKKRQRESQNNDDPQHSPPSKRFSSSTLTAEDMELLDNY